MAKMTLSQLKTFTSNYVAAAKQAGTWSNSTDNLIGLIDKIGKQITLDGTFNDTLPELNGDDLPYGKTIEEWFIDLTLPTTYTDPTASEFNAADTLKPYLPSVEDVAYNYTLKRAVISTTVPFDNFERAALSAEEAGNMAAKIMERLTNSYTLFTYAQKKQLLGNLVTKAITAKRYATVSVPANTETAEAFIKQVKGDVEAASFASEGTSLGGALIGAAPELILFVKKGVMPTVQVDAMAGAFHAEDLAIPAKIKVVDDFGNASNNVFAILADPRGIKLHRGYHAVRENLNGQGDFINYFDHSENTGFISKNTFVQVYTTQA